MKNNGNGIGKDALARKVEVRDDAGRLVEIRHLTLYADLLSAIHNEGVKSIITEVLQLPTPENNLFAVVKATVETGMGTFTGLGDASPESVADDFHPHLLRVAETRAKARALRDALGIGVVAYEEIVGELTSQVPRTVQEQHKGNGNGHDNHRDQPGNGGVAHEQPQPQTPAPSPAHASAPAPSAPSAPTLPLITENQRRLLFRLLHGKGIEGDAARDYLLKALNVSRLNDASRRAASDLIDKLNRSNGDAEATRQEGGHA